MGVLFSSLPVVYLHFLLNDRVSSNSSEHSVYQFFIPLALCEVTERENRNPAYKLFGTARGAAIRRH